jgi:GDP-4-dehydro-6-deoxy-D-mannose reductase
MAKRVLVTGASGFLGGHVLSSLLGEPVELIGWRRPTTETPRTAGTSWAYVDILDRSAVAKAIQAARPDHIYHFAGFANPSRAATQAVIAMEVNLLGTVNLLAAVQEYAPRARILVPSSGLLYAPTPDLATERFPCTVDSPYAASKMAQELTVLDAARVSGLDVLVVRLFNTVGPGQSSEYAIGSFASQLVAAERGKGEAVSTGNLEVVRDFVDVRDAVSAFRLLFAHGSRGDVYNVCSGQSHRLADVLELLRSLASVRVPIRTASHQFRRHGDRMILSGDPTKLKNLGWQCAHRLENSLADTLNYFRCLN